jgi:Myosin N-terminal SH3-like domain
VGSQVWAEDPVEAWIDGEVLEVNGDSIKIQATNGKTVSYFPSIFISSTAVAFNWLTKTCRNAYLAY